LSDDMQANRVRVPQGVLSREVQGETVLLNLESGEYFGLDAVATRIWQLLSESGDVGGVESTMCDEFEVEPAVASKDVRALVAELLKRRLLEATASEAEA
jgi:hypothetical protein